MTNIKKDDFVITSKGNYGKVISVGTSIANVKIGYKVHEIELYNLHNINDGIHLKVKYLDIHTSQNGECMVFVKHNDVLFDCDNRQLIVDKIADLVIKKTSIKNVSILKLIIP